MQTMLPLDCLGECVKFLSSSSTFLFKIYALSTLTKTFFDNERFDACENIVFQTNIRCWKYNKNNSPKKYVISVCVVYEVPLTLFPNAKKVYIQTASKSNFCFHNEYFADLLKLPKVEFIEVNKICRLDDYDLAFFKDLKTVIIPDQRGVNEKGLKFLANVEKLDISGTGKVRGYCFENMPKLKSLVASRCGLLREFEGLKNITELEIRSSTMIEDKDLSCFSRLESLTLFDNEYISDVGLMALPCETIRKLEIVNCPYVTNEGFGGFQNLEVLKNPFSNHPHHGVTLEVLKFFPKLKVLETGNNFAGFVGEELFSVKSIGNSLEKLCVWDVRDHSLDGEISGLNDDSFKTMVNFKNLRVLYLQNSGKDITDLGIRLLISLLHEVV